MGSEQIDPERNPFEAESRTLPIRRLTPTETEILGYEAPVQLSRLQFGRFGWWRSSKWYCIETARRKRLMTVTKKELALYDITPDGSGGFGRGRGV